MLQFCYRDPCRVSKKREKYMLWQCTISSAAKHCMVLMKYRSYYHCARHFEGSGEGGFALSFFFFLKIYAER